MDSDQRQMFFDSVREYFSKAASYIIENFPLQDELLGHAEVVDVSKRKESDFSSIRFFVNRFPCLLPTGAKIMDLQMQFLRYQVDKLPSGVVEADRIDVAWHLISQIKDLTTGLPMYGLLCRVMLAILVIPHSNADSERIFSCVRKNQTEFRPNMGVHLLESLIVTKVDRSAKKTPCYEQTYSKEILTRAKSATFKSLQKEDKMVADDSEMNVKILRMLDNAGQGSFSVPEGQTHLS